MQDKQGFLAKIGRIFTFWQKGDKQSPTIDDIWEDDLLDRKKVAINLIKFLGEIKDQHKIVFLDSPMGSGGTFFIKKLMEHLRHHNHISVYYNAWNINVADNAFIPFVDFIFTELLTAGKVEPKMLKKFGLLSESLFSLNSLSRIISQSPLRVLSAFFEVTQDAVNTSKSGVSLNEAVLFKKKKEKIDNFKQQFEEIVQLIRKDKHNIYVLVDNLDQCRPEITVEFIEQAKYIFNSIGMIFVINADTQRIAEAFSDLYGSKSDVVGYQRYADLKLKLPKIANLAPYIKHLEKKLGFQELFNDNDITMQYKNVLLSSFRLYAQHFPISLIEIYKSLNEIRMMIPFISHLHLPNLLSFLVLLKHWREDLYLCITEEEHQKVLALFKREIQPIFKYLISTQHGTKEWNQLMASVEIAVIEITDEQQVSKIIGKLDKNYFFPDPRTMRNIQPRLIESLRNLISITF